MIVLKNKYFDKNIFYFKNLIDDIKLKYFIKYNKFNGK